LLALSSGCDEKSHDDETNGQHRALFDPPSAREDADLCEEASEAGEGELCDDPEYKHPLRGRALADGRVPHFEVQTGPKGGRYAMVERFVQEEGSDQPFKSSGVEEVEVRPMSAAEIDAADSTKEKAPTLLFAPAKKLSAKLERRLAENEKSDSPESLEVAVLLSRTFEEPIQVEFAKAIARDEVRTFSEAHLRRQEIIEQRAQRIRTNNQGVAARARTLNLTVNYECRNTDCVVVSGPAGAMRTFLDHPRIESADLETGAAGTDSIDNDWLDEIHDRQQFEDQGYDGQSLATTTTAAIIESGSYYANHLGFREDSGTGTRLRGRFDCIQNPCNDNPDWTQPCVTDDSGFICRHATQVAGAVAADFDDNQSAVYNTEALQNERSASNPESKLYLYRGTGASSFSRVRDHVMAVSPSPEVANLSWSDSDGDTACLGDTNFAKSVNRIYEAGILPIKTAGNEEDPEGLGSTTNCTIGDPGSAIGAFVVGNLDDEDGSLCAAQASPIRECTGANCGSSWGGNATQGGRRSIVDLAAYGQQNNRVCGTSDLANCNFGGTSSAAPTVAGAALNYVDQFGAQLSEGIRDPGHLHAHMLLMGDRAHRSGTTESFQFAGFSNRYGAGRMRMRMINAQGLDAPNYFISGEVCVGHKEVITIKPNDDTAVQSGTDTAKVVLYWYDRRHENGTAIDDIDVHMKGKTTSGSLLWTRTSQNSFDEKEMAFQNASVGDSVISFDIHGFNVTADSEGCGTNKMRVFYAFVAEDSARNDAEGPTWNATSCLGQPPL
jgi:hypothetical protein